MKMRATVSTRGQVTIPKALREQLGIEPGTMLDLCAAEGMLVAKVVTDDDSEAPERDRMKLIWNAPGLRML